jgi:hypothetical protein
LPKAVTATIEFRADAQDRHALIALSNRTALFSSRLSVSGCNAAATTTMVSVLRRCRALSTTRRVTFVFMSSGDCDLRCRRTWRCGVWKFDRRTVYTRRRGCACGQRLSARTGFALAVSVIPLLRGRATVPLLTSLQSVTVVRLDQTAMA